jgi:hypothetical protein
MGAGFVINRISLAFFGAERGTKLGILSARGRKRREHGGNQDEVYP